MKYQGNEYTSRNITDSTVKVTRWNGDEKTWSEIVTQNVADTQGDTIRKAKAMNKHSAFLEATFGTIPKGKRIERRNVIKGGMRSLLKDKEVVPLLFCLTDRVKNLGGLGAIEVLARIGWNVLEPEEFQEIVVTR